MADIDALLEQRGDILECLSGDELLGVSYELLDEILVLRGKRKADDIVFNAMNQLIKELTDHADAMRDLLDQFGSELDPEASGHCAAAVTTYDDFIREA